MSPEIENEFLPARYHIEIYPSNFDEYPFYSAKSKSHFPVPVVGQTMDGRSFQNHGFASHQLKVVGVEHIYCTIENSHVSHKLMIAVEELNPSTEQNGI